jgi:putative transcriptional regulator
MAGAKEAFALRYGFNIGRLRDLEQRRTKPDSVVRAYWLVIQKKPDAVRDALAA